MSLPHILASRRHPSPSGRRVRVIPIFLCFPSLQRILISPLMSSSDYSPQMTKEDIKKLYFRLTREFSRDPFEEVIKECHVIIKKYYSCFPLLLKMALLLTNHYMLAKEKDLQEKTLNEVVDLCRRIKDESEDVGLLNEANSLEAICFLILQRPEKVLDLLAGTKKPTTSDDVVLASAYQMTGNMQKANEVLQSGHLLSPDEFDGHFAQLSRVLTKMIRNASR